MNLFPGRDNKPDWNDPDIRSINASSANGCLIPFPTYKKCFDAVSDYRRYLSDYVHLLNEGWVRKGYDHVYDLPEKINWPHDDSEKINLPYYTNQYSNNKSVNALPYADVHQPVTLLAHNCILPHYWSSLRKKITFAGMACAFHLFVNGRPAGYSDVRHTPISFDITSFWHEGENEIVLVLYSSAASDHIRGGWHDRISGILSDIYIEAFPAIYLSDVNLNCEPQNSDHTKWSFSIMAELSSCRISLESPSVRFDLYDDYKLLVSREIDAVLQPLMDSSRKLDNVKTISSVEYSVDLEEIKPWSADQPNVYDLYITLSDNRGYEQVSYHMPVGFRKLERKGNSFLLNGRPLILTTANSVISSDISASTEAGIANKYSTVAERISDKLIEVKKSGCNCLFLSDGIKDPAVFELADMLGLFLIVSTDIYPDNFTATELTGRWPIQTAADFWTNIMSAAAADLINTAKAHCSVIAWNIGHNLTKWPQLDRLLKTCTGIDQSRLLMVPASEGADRDHPSVYFASSGLKAVITNNLKQISKYQDLNLPIFFASANIYHLANDNSDTLYLLKTGKLPIFGTFLLNNPSTASTVPDYLAETASLKNLHASIDIDQGNLVLQNLHPFAVISNIVVDWQSNDNQNWISGSKIEADILGAGSSMSLKLEEIGEIIQKPSHINFKISWTDNSWPHQGQRRTVCFTLPWSEHDRTLIEPPSGRYTPLSHGRIRLEQDRHHLLISGSRFWFIFNKITGSFESWRCGETELLSSIDNKLGAGPYWQLTYRDKNESVLTVCSSHVESIIYDCDGDGAVIEVKSLITANDLLRFIGTTRYEISHKGELKIAAGIEYDSSSDMITENSLINLELVFDLSRHLNQLQWYGFGPTAVESLICSKLQPLPAYPHPNNWLRMHSELISSNAQSWYGAHWLYTGNEQGLGLLIKSDSFFSFAASQLAADIHNQDSRQFFSRHYGQLRLEFARLQSTSDFEENSNINGNIPSVFEKQKGQSIAVIKRQYILQPSALNFI